MVPWIDVIRLVASWIKRCDPAPDVLKRCELVCGVLYRSCIPACGGVLKQLSLSTHCVLHKTPRREPPGGQFPNYSGNGCTNSQHNRNGPFKVDKIQTDDSLWGLRLPLTIHLTQKCISQEGVSPDFSRTADERPFKHSFTAA